LIVTADSVTHLPAIAGDVLVTGSHGGRVAAFYAAKAGVRAVVFHDAGLGLDEAGVAGLALLETAAIAAAAVSHASARIGDGGDVLARGIISRCNGPAAACGVEAGQRCHDAAVRLLAAAPAPLASLPEQPEGRYALTPGVLGCDSIGQLRPDDAGRVLVIGSHASLHGGRVETALPVFAVFAVFHEGGGDCSRLPVLASRGIPAAAAAGWSARIGDARSLWETGMLGVVNDAAAAAGLASGMRVRAACERFRAPQQNT
jgi:hypothetical protein